MIDDNINVLAISRKNMRLWIVILLPSTD